MDKKLKKEMIDNIICIDNEMPLSERSIFLFGHCSATLELADVLLSKRLSVAAILDNSETKQGMEYRGIGVVYPDKIMDMAGSDQTRHSVVLISSRFFCSMLEQLRDIGYEGPVRKVIDYNTFAEYSLSDDTISRMRAREKHGEELIAGLVDKYKGYFRVFCPFNALGDIFFMISYWEEYAKTRNISSAVFCVPSMILTDVIRMFGDYPVEVYEQKELDAMIQAVIYTNDEMSFIAHQDRPYVINLHKALYIKKIPLDIVYRCGVYGLPRETVPALPRIDLPIYEDFDFVVEGRTVIFSPYAKSVTAIDSQLWERLVEYFNMNGYLCLTNVAGDEKPLEGTRGICPKILQIRSLVEYAGTFIGIRSGLCDVLRGVNAKKIALYPDYNYCDTKWKAIDMYAIDDFDNIVVEDEDTWEDLKTKLGI